MVQILQGLIDASSEFLAPVSAPNRQMRVSSSNAWHQLYTCSVGMKLTGQTKGILAKMTQVLQCNSGGVGCSWASQT